MGFIYRPDHPQANENGMIDRNLAEAEHPATDPRFYVQSDEMAATRHMCDNKLYTSKHKFRETTKAHGCLEVGTDPAILRSRKPVPLSREKRRDDIRRAIYEIKNGRRI